VSKEEEASEQETWSPLGEVLLGQARARLEAAEHQVDTAAQTAVKASADEASTASTLLRRMAHDSSEHDAVSSARDAAKAAAADAKQNAAVHRQVTRALLDDLARLGAG
jgi:hypothetical protein